MPFFARCPSATSRRGNRRDAQLDRPRWLHDRSGRDVPCRGRGPCQDRNASLEALHPRRGAGHAFQLAILNAEFEAIIRSSTAKDTDGRRIIPLFLPLHSGACFRPSNFDWSEFLEQNRRRILRPASCGVPRRVTVTEWRAFFLEAIIYQTGGNAKAQEIDALYNARAAGADVRTGLERSLVPSAIGREPPAPR